MDRVISLQEYKNSKKKTEQTWILVNDEDIFFQITPDYEKDEVTMGIGNSSAMVSVTCTVPLYQIRHVYARIGILPEEYLCPELEVK